MFEDRTIPVIAYNLNTVFAERIETLISRGAGNTRGRDYYDIYILLTMEKARLSRFDLLYALRVKANERGSLPAIDDHTKIINDIAESPDTNLFLKTWILPVATNPVNDHFGYFEMNAINGINRVLVSLVLSEEKPQQKESFLFSSEQSRTLFPQGYSPVQKQQHIEKALNYYNRYLERKRSEPVR